MANTSEVSLKQQTVEDLIWTAHLIEFWYTKVLNDAGVPLPVYRVLKVLAAHGDQGISVSDIQNKLPTRRSDVSRLVRNLVVRGSAQYEKKKGDRRLKLIFITPPGKKCLADLRQSLDWCHERQLGHMTKRELMNLGVLLEKVRSVHL